MNPVTAAKMLALLEQSPMPTPEDDAHFIIHRLLRTEVRKGKAEAALFDAQREFLEATREEVLVWLGGEDGCKPRAMKMYRERTGSGLYEAKKQLEAGAARLNALEQQLSGVTSCG
jgi:ribosomal protein L7/L12